MDQVPLSLDPNNANRQAPEKKPVIGWFAVGSGLLGIFTIVFVFVPLAFIFSLIALFTGQIAWGFGGLLLAIMGLITSPELLLMLGMGAFAMWFDWNDFVRPILEFIGWNDTTEV